MSDQPDNNPPHTFVKDRDLTILAIVAVIGMSVLVGFGVYLHLSGLLAFPDAPGTAAERDYLNDTLLYRERRTAMALLMRTFLIGFAFVVGLALCAMGGLFILRQVSAKTSLSASGEGELGAKGGFSFASYSPGVVFMVGGVAVIAITQALALNVKPLEVVPPVGQSFCRDDAGNLVTCAALGRPSASASEAIPGEIITADSGLQMEVYQTAASEQAQPIGPEGEAPVEAVQLAMTLEELAALKVRLAEVPSGRVKLDGVGVGSMSVLVDGIPRWIDVSLLDPTKPAFGLVEAAISDD
ncbi:MAG: hypothetical protein AAGK00_06230 [Pseudomonadota bacterium]